MSMQLNPEATNASRSANAPGSSTVHPNTLPPNMSGAIERPEFPIVRLFIRFNPFLCGETGHRPVAAQRGGRHNQKVEKRRPILNRGARHFLRWGRKTKNPRKTRNVR